DANNSLAKLKSTLNKIVNLTEEYNPIEIVFYIDILENNIVIFLPPKDDELNKKINKLFIDATRPYKPILLFADDDDEPPNPLMQKRQESSSGSISGMILSGDGIAGAGDCGGIVFSYRDLRLVSLIGIFSASGYVSVTVPLRTILDKFEVEPYLLKSLEDPEDINS
ncbi:18996_t:CDS:2, partial [Racocetra persica]